MSNRPLRKCPTCGQELTDEIREWMGLRNGETLNSMCRGAIGPSDIDHVLHNGKVSPERIQFFEYKNGGTVGPGQAWLHRSLTGDWQDTNKPSRLLSIRFNVLPAHPKQGQREVLEPLLGWVGLGKETRNG